VLSPSHCDILFFKQIIQTNPKDFPVIYINFPISEEKPDMKRILTIQKNNQNETTILFVLINSNQGFFFNSNNETLNMSANVIIKGELHVYS
jgi:hypothetical protein